MEGELLIRASSSNSLARSASSARVYSVGALWGVIIRRALPEGGECECDVEADSPEYDLERRLADEGPVEGVRR